MLILDPANSFGERFRIERERLGLTQAELARRSSNARLLINKYELGKALPGTQALIKLDSCGVDVAFLLTGKRSTLEREPELFNRAYLEVKRLSNESGESLTSKELLARAWAVFHALNSADSELSSLRAA